MKFPDDFRKRPHPLSEIGGYHWTYPKASATVISVVGGGTGMHGDGVTTFEMWDKREDEPRPYQTAEEINNHLKEHPIEDE